MAAAAAAAAASSGEAAEAAEAAADAPLRGLLSQLMPEAQADRILRHTRGARCRFEEHVASFSDDQLQKLEPVRSSLLNFGLENQQVDVLFAPQLWNPRFLMLEVMRHLLTEIGSTALEQQLVSVEYLWDRWAGWAHDLEDEGDEDVDLEELDHYDEDMLADYMLDMDF